MNRNEWAGKSAVVTGAGTGIGRSVSLELARRGAIVYVTALTEAEAQLVADDIISEGGKAAAAKLDVTDNAEFLTVLQRVAAEQGTLDLVVNNAGIMYVGEFAEMDAAFLGQLIDVNFKAVAIGTLYTYRIMKEQGSGLIVNVASQGGLMPVGTMAAYSGTKHGVVGLTASVAGEAEAFGVEFKTVCPGNVSSEMLNKAKTRGTDADAVLDQLPKLMPADEAARLMVDGFSKRPRNIIIPFYSRLLGVKQRLWPEFGHKGAVHSAKQFRLKRDDTRSQH
jgi:short-subunit dehydrogenase